MQDIGDRMKGNYELRHRHYLTRRTPVIVRVDGKAFHTFTRGLNKPFDDMLICSMVRAAQRCVSEMQGCQFAYIQSDEASFLLTDYATFQTSGWFDYCQNKIESVTASIYTAEFNRHCTLSCDAYFDARAFNLPREEVANYFVWRMKDWHRNSLAMLCQSHFSHRQLHGKSRAEQHELLHSIGINWADLAPVYKNGTWVTPSGLVTSVRPQYDEVAALIEPGLYCDKLADLGAQKAPASLERVTAMSRAVERELSETLRGE